MIHRTLLTLALLAACDDAPAPATESTKRSTDDPSATLPCDADDDCPPLACGPCTPGRAVTVKDTRTDCKTDPCERGHGGSVCGPDHVCVVRPDARPRPGR